MQTLGGITVPGSREVQKVFIIMIIIIIVAICIYVYKYIYIYIYIYTYMYREICIYTIICLAAKQNGIVQYALACQADHCTERYC